MLFRIVLYFFYFSIINLEILSLIINSFRKYKFSLFFIILIYHLKNRFKL